MNRTEARQLGKGLAFTSPWIIGFLIFTLLPVILSFYYSMCDYSLLQSPTFTGLQNYEDLANDPVFWRSLRNTLYYAMMALPAGLCVSLGLAMLLNVKMPGQVIFRTIIYLPSLVPIVASAMLWMWLFNARLGILNSVLANLGIYFGRIVPPIILIALTVFGVVRLFRSVRGLLARIVLTLFAAVLCVLLMRTYVAAFDAHPHPWLAQIGIQGPGWLSDANWAMPSLALMSIWGVGNAVVIYLAGLQDVPKELYEAAEIDGAGLWGRTWHVTLPMLSPVIFFNLVMSIIGVLQVFEIPYIMTAGGPARATLFLSMYLRDNAFSYLKMGYASAMAWIMLLLVLALTGFAFWSSKRWVHYQGK